MDRRRDAAKASGPGETPGSASRSRPSLYNDAVKPVSVGNIMLGDAQPLTLIAGPCVIESEDHTLSLARAINAVATRCAVPFILKASFDKANRTSLSSFRGPGLEGGLAILAKVKAAVDVPILTDIHECAQASPAAEVADVLQIPAFLCRQTDLLLSAAATGRAVNIKKGQFLAPEDIQHVVAKLASSGYSKILVTERGTSFGYHNLVVDMRSFPILRGFGYPVVFDVTHSVQLPGGGQGKSGGQAEFISTLACAGVAAGVNAVFLEVHETPSKAKSDGANALSFDLLEPLLHRLVALHAVRAENQKETADATLRSPS